MSKNQSFRSDLRTNLQQQQKKNIQSNNKIILFFYGLIIGSLIFGSWFLVFYLQNRHKLKENTHKNYPILNFLEDKNVGCPTSSSCPDCPKLTCSPCPSTIPCPVSTFTPCPVSTSTPCPVSTFTPCPISPTSSCPPLCINFVPRSTDIFQTSEFINSNKNYTAYIFTRSQTISFPCDVLNVVYLVVGGGGGGGINGGGGGGGGGVLTGTTFFNKNVNYTLTIGTGGQGIIRSTTTCAGTNAKGGNTILQTASGNFTALGGGAGACRDYSLSQQLRDGGCGGGGGSGGNPALTPAGNSQSSQGFNGGTGWNDGGNSAGGGGGGGGSVGVNANKDRAGNGGTGYQFINGLFYSGGGGGGITLKNLLSVTGLGGSNIGGNGGINQDESGSSAVANRGSGGGGGGPNGSGGAGSDGVIILAIQQ